MGKALGWVWHLGLSLSYPHQTLPDIYSDMRRTERNDAAVAQSLAKWCCVLPAAIAHLWHFLHIVGWRG